MYSCFCISSREVFLVNIIPLALAPRSLKRIVKTEKKIFFVLNIASFTFEPLTDICLSASDLTSLSRFRHCIIYYNNPVADSAIRDVTDNLTPGINGLLAHNVKWFEGRIQRITLWKWFGVFSIESAYRLFFGCGQFLSLYTPHLRYNYNSDSKLPAHGKSTESSCANCSVTRFILLRRINVWKVRLSWK